MRKIVLAAAFCAALAASGSAQDKAAFDKINEKFSEALNKGDAAAVAAMYTDDAVLLPPGSDMVKGRSEIRSFWQKTAEQAGDLKLTTVDVKALGSDAAREIGTFVAKTKGAQPQEVPGKYVVVWRKVGGDWKLATDIWNANK
jgi:uncharacterized protein (TIGR02246 family)